MNPVLTRKICLRRFHFERDAFGICAQACKTPIISRLAANPCNACPRSLYHRRRPFAVSGHKQFSLLGEQLRQRALFPRHPRHIHEKLEMLPANARDDPVIWLDHLHERCQLSWMIRANLQYRDSMGVLKVQ